MPSHLTHYTNPKPLTSSWEDIVKQLVAIRREMKLSQEGLAHKIGCAPSLIHKWEQFKRVPSGFMFSCWLDALEAKIKIEKE